MTNFLNYTVDKTPNRPASPKTPARFHLKKRTKKSLKMIGLLVLVFFILMGGLAGLNYGHAKTAYDQALAGKASFEKAEGAIGTQDFSAAQTHLQAANAEFTSSRESMGKLWMLHFFPFVARQYSAAKHLLDAGIEASSGALELVQIGVTIGDRIGGGEDFTFGHVTEESKTVILEEIYNSPPKIESAIGHFDLAIQSVEKIPDTGILEQISAATAIFEDTLPPTNNALKEFLPLATALPQMAGYPDEQHYLLYFLNNTELRPGGGFIGTYGELTVRNGEFQQLFTDDAYNLDDKSKDTLFVEPPWPMRRLLGSSQWFMRDSNWSPDFRTSSEQGLDFYQKENGALNPVHGVIGLTPNFTASLLEITGPIESHGITFTHENFVDELEYQVEVRFAQQGIPMEERKAIIGDLSNHLIAEILTLPLSEWPKLLSIFQTEVSQKQIMFYFTDPELQQLASNMGWTGKFVDTELDYLRVVDANLGSLKSDPGVERTISYTIQYNEEKDALIGRVDVHYVNTNNLGPFTTRYHTFTRVYVPEGSELLSYEGNEDTVETTSDLGRTVFSTLKTIEVHEDEHLIFTYQLPERMLDYVNNGTYTLDVQKQLGAANYGLNVNMEFDQSISSISPNGTISDDNHKQGTVNATLDTDQRIMVEF